VGILRPVDPREPSSALAQWKRRRIVKEIVNRGVPATCARCQQRELSIYPRLTYFEMQPLPEMVNVSAPVIEQRIPAALLICGNCGHMMFHAVGSLGLGEIIKSDADSDPDDELEVDQP